MATYEPTDFSKFSHADLILMLQYGNPAAVDEAAAELDSVASFMDTQRATLEDKLTAFEPYWSGAGAQDYFTMMRGLIAASGTIADLSRRLRDQIYAARDALAKAQASMPAPVPVTPLNLDPTVLAAINGTPVNGASPAATQQALQQALAQYQATQAQANTANLAAVQVMIALANTDRSLNDSVPAVPDAVSAPQPGDVLTTYNGGYGLSPDFTKPGTKPLFGDVYANGVASAQLAYPGSVPGLVNPAGNGYQGYGSSGYGGLGNGGLSGGGQGPDLGNLGSDLGGLGAGAAGLKSALGNGKGFGGVGGAPAVPTGDPGLAVREAAAGPESIAGAAGNGVAGGAGGFGGAPFMGGMGGAGGMGAGSGNGRLAKSWLVEQDPEIFGVKMGEVLPTELERLLGLG